MMKTVTCSSVAVSRGRRLEKRITPSGARRAPDHDHEAEHEQRVGEDRADDRRLRDDELALLQREDHDEQLRAGCRASTAASRSRRGRSARRAARCANDTTQARPASASVASAKRGTGGPGAVVGDARQRREHGDAQERDALRVGQRRACRGRLASSAARSVALEHSVDQAVLERLLGREEAVALHVRRALPRSGLPVCSA